MKGHFGKRKVKHTKKLKLLVTICLISSTLAPIFPGLTFIEAKAAVGESLLQTIRSNIVENELPSITKSNETVKEKEPARGVTSLVPENVEPEKKVDSSADLTQAAESKITIVDTGIILKNDGTYILTDSPEMYYEDPSQFPISGEIKGEGEYDENTIIEFTNSNSYLENRIYSEPRTGDGNNKVQQIIRTEGTQSNLTICRNSTLDVTTTLDYGIYVDHLNIGEPTELVRLPVTLNVNANQIGIYTPAGITNYTGSATARATKAGISVVDELAPDREEYVEVNTFVENMDLGAFGEAQPSYEGRFDTSMTATATDPDSTGALLKFVNLKGATLNATGEKYGLFDGGITVLDTANDEYASPSPTYISNISGTSTDGIGFFSFMDFRNDAGIVTGKTTNGIGIEAYNITMTDQNETGNAPEVNGMTGTGFGILTRTYDSYSDSLSIGSINVTSGKINGHTQDGTGIMSSISGQLFNLADIEVSGTATIGQGIIGSQLTLSNQVQSGAPKLDFTATSNGSSTATMSMVKKILATQSQESGISLDKFPSSVGVVALQGLEVDSQGGMGFDTNFTATAPINEDNSYGVYSPEGSESGVNIQGIKYTNIVIAGDIGMQTGALSMGRSDETSDASPVFSVDVDGRTAGINAPRFIISFNGYNSTSEDMQINIEASEGNGINVPYGLQWDIMTYDQKWRLPVNITATDTGISAPDPAASGSASYYQSGINIINVGLVIDNARLGFSAIKQENYSLRDSTIKINSSEDGLVFDEEGGSGYGYGSIDNTTVDIDSGTYGWKLNQLPNISFSSYVEGGATATDSQIKVTADQYPIWISTSEVVNISNDPGYHEETGNSLGNTFSFIATSRNLVPDKADYPALYVENYNVDMGGSEGVQFIENYQTAVSQPFNTTPSSPYKTVSPFNVEKYGNYQWSATRTDTGGDVVIDESQIANNKLSTNDTSYTEAKLTASREKYLTDERIFNADVSGDDKKILHQINMIVRREEQYKVTYDGNGADGGDVPTDSNLYSENDSVNVASQGNLTLTDHTFVGWLNSADGQVYQNPQIASSPTTYKMGKSDVTFTAQWRSNSVVEELSLIDGKIPSHLNFGTHEIQYDTDKTFYATDDGTNTENGSANNLTTGEIGMLDTRLGTEGWSLTVKQLAQFKTSTNQELSSAELGFKVGPLDTSQSTGGIPSGVDDEEITLIPGNATELLRASNGQGKGTVTLPIERFTLKIPKTSAKHVGQSTTEVEWLLSNVP
ncbi:WxL domain-containing protein [Enterococcus sp. AZ103]|uniref:WxL domain-containing protein n=1 Tax=Enterococcus sp. AZ103 TaxID=2774628 RepID=UPI003F26B95D